MRKRRKNRLLVYAHYYYPDVAATGQLLMELMEGLSPNFAVTVICTVPSYSGTVAERYRTRWFYREEINGVKVLRVRVPSFSKAERNSRIKSIVAYAARSLVATFLVGGQDQVLSISQPPVLGGLLGLWGSVWKRARFIYNIQDFNPEQVVAVGYAHKKWLLNLMKRLDCLCCRCADRIILVGKDMEETLRQRFRGRKVPGYAVIPNWIDEGQVCPLPMEHEKIAAFRREHGLEGKFVIMYSGNIGLYYDLVNLVKVIEDFCNGQASAEIRTAVGREVVFAFVGGGAVLSQLMAYKEEHRMDNIVFIPYQEKEELSYSLNAADAHWCVSMAGMKGISFPSKCYGIMAVGKPVLGVLEPGSGARELLEDAGCGRCCDPGDYDRIAELIGWCLVNDGSDQLEKMGLAGRRYLEENLTKQAAIERYAEEIGGGREVCLVSEDVAWVEQRGQRATPVSVTLESDRPRHGSVCEGGGRGIQYEFVVAPEKDGQVKP